MKKEACPKIENHQLSIQGCDVGRISPQDLMNRDLIDFGCNGGSPIFSWKWARFMGLTTEDCIPYVSGDGQVPTCPKECVNGSDIHRIKANKVDAVSEFGPFELTFMVYEDFMTYATSDYQLLEGILLDGHAVVLISWGVENNIPYWIVQNSWSEDWGEEV
ncbi:MAG: putative cathepsin B5 cysteine protease [Streblomastix strix]|uniref:Putative cathepsin B5 cysteine protease n=1 Tax=Streblomastix strix TaxID=222440 RepID=A0A5J4WFM0_9EUKA|nr:MAG: putative cathepsin B5 cysteine protease [Streblomastix strix]